MTPLRIVVMGTGPFAVPMFRALVASAHRLVAVVTRPDRAAGGRRPARNPMREAAAAAGVGVLDPERVNDPAVVASLATLRPDLFVVCDYGQILSRDLLAVPPLGGINLHGSLLPRHRGAAPVQWAIRAGDPVTGVSVIHMTPALDAGHVIVARATSVAPRETAAELEPRLAELGAGAVLDAVDRLQATLLATGSVAGIGIPQDAAQATRAPRLSKQDGIVDWSQPAALIERLRRALEPWPRLTTFWTRGDGQRQRLVLDDVEALPGPAAATSSSPGRVLDTADGRIVVACGGGSALAITGLVPEGRRPMTAADFLRGSSLLPGAVLG
ncbi:MAG: methionyl-tRNA formyltransferase [Planctomycetes bacterium]|nr:methionyl-tRNA formyltransferase [Planctomycetota bacterium]